MAMSKISEFSSALPSSVCESPFPPPIPLVSKVKKMDKVDGSDTDKSDWIKLEFLINPDKPAVDFKDSRQFPIFKDRCNFQRNR
jgi:hypothetical protein